MGKPLTRELDGYHSARRGAYRVIYRIDETERIVHVVRIDHRADVYRPDKLGARQVFDRIDSGAAPTSTATYVLPVKRLSSAELDP